MLPFKCDVHKWMNAWVGVLEHPFYSVSGKAALRARRDTARHMHDRGLAREAGRANAADHDRPQGIEKDLVRLQGVMLHLFALLVAAFTGILIFAGGLVTSTESGLSCPDWPNTYGYFMFFFPLEKMVGGIRTSTHRLIASTVGFLILVLAAWLWRAETRRWYAGSAISHSLP